MSELKRGALISIMVHLMVLSPFFSGIREIFSSPRPEPLDIGFSFHLKPLGNTLDRSAMNPGQKFVPAPRKALSDGTGEESIKEEEQGDPQKKYGVEDGSEGVDDFYISENYGSIMGTISNRLLYPSLARRNGWQGKVMVTFLITTDGRILDVRVKKSSGFAVLDSSAIKTIRSIKNLPHPKNPTRITLPISFKLD